ncbi:MAG TPA: protein kinase [Actinocrinis sp.]|uniref:protein kinase domain-containing protein n=1 Tax=Actinocrinis sp. TaxID=1920516 RepID=UPI002DDCC5D1|nr:protein kinase [Actinocrinis sp.]HEV2347001.1 protein kinase [Actinocrinis sp.]
MHLDPMHPAAWVVEELRAEGWIVHDLLAFTRSSTLMAASRGSSTPLVVKVGFGSNHVLHQLSVEQRPAAYGFYWYQQLTDAERALSRDDFRYERDLTIAATSIEHIVPAVEHGTSEHFDWYAMPLCDGGNFRPYLGDSKDRAIGLRVLGDIAYGIAALHTHGIVHRDVYQENILIHGGRGLLTDLGAARRIGTPRGPRTRAPEPHWPPEYATAYDSAAAAADVFSLAVLVFRFLIGDLPRLDGKRDIPKLPSSLRQLVPAALRHDPGMRPVAAEIAEALYEAAESCEQ